MKKIIVFSFMCFAVTSFGQGFLHKDRQKIVYGNGNNVVLRGLRLGGWMVQAEKDGQITWLEEVFKMTCDLLNWCAANKIYLISNLHKTPRDQEKDAAISNYDVSKPSLWEQMQRNKVEMLWQNIFR
jgi:hypothetical protein